MGNRLNRQIVMPYGKQYKSLYVPSQSISLTGDASEPDVRAPENFLAFAGTTANEDVYFNVQVPFDWVPPFDWLVEILWAKGAGATGNVAWKLEHDVRATGVAAAAGTALTSSTLSDDTVTGGVANTQYVTVMGSIDGDTLVHNATINFHLTRLQDNAADTFTSDAWLYGILFKVPVNTFGFDTPDNR